MSKCIAVALEKAEKHFVITYDLVSITNIQNLDENLKSHDHEEADTLLLLHTIDVVSKRDPFCKCVVFSPDTDVFLLLVYYSEVLPQMASFRTGLMKTDEDVLLSLSKLNEDLTNLETLENLELFVVQLYGRFNYPNKDVTLLAELRWHLFSKFQQDAEKLPPTMSALKYKVFRVHYVSTTLRKSRFIATSTSCYQLRLRKQQTTMVF